MSMQRVIFSKTPNVVYLSKNYLKKLGERDFNPRNYRASVSAGCRETALFLAHSFLLNSIDHSTFPYLWVSSTISNDRFEKLPPDILKIILDVSTAFGSVLYNGFIKQKITTEKSSFSIIKGGTATFIVFGPIKTEKIVGERLIFINLIHAFTKAIAREIEVVSGMITAANSEKTAPESRKRYFSGSIEKLDFWKRKFVNALYCFSNTGELSSLVQYRKSLTSPVQCVFDYDMPFNVSGLSKTLGFLGHLKKDLVIDNGNGSYIGNGYFSYMRIKMIPSIKDCKPEHKTRYLD